MLVRRFSQRSIPAAMDIYVQVLPICRPHPKTCVMNGKILLCKWASGNFKDRYTGLIRPFQMQGSQPERKSKSGQTKSESLAEAAKSLLPSKLQSKVGRIDLVGLLRFDDPPALDEYIYLADLTVAVVDDRGGGDDVDFGEILPFGNDREHSCSWFDWRHIPFDEMPADDALWYPKVLWESRKVTGSFTFGSQTEKSIKSYDLSVVDNIEVE